MMEDLYNFWYDNKNLWFGASSEDDNKLSEYFGKLFDKGVDIEKMLESRKEAVGTIILYDQISRHIMRTSAELTLFGEPIDKLNFGKKTSDLSIEYAEKVYSYYRHAFFADEYVFVMLPLRHSYDFNKIKFVMMETWDKIECEREVIEIEKYKKFLKATYERTIKQSNDIQAIQFYPKEEEQEEGVLDFKEIHERYSDILDKFECKDVLDKIECKEIKKDLINKFKENLVGTQKTSFIMSISGGVDSMVCSYILKQLNIPFVCVHINYNNRKECVKEEDFVVEWCRLLNIDLYLRKIDEINRPQCMKYNLRDVYERYTRDVRYGTYVKVNKENCNVILGHNQDDCFENILTNISQKSKYENLNGMDTSSSLKFMDTSINFIRPMLDISKKQIYDFANALNIPYLWDSTPKWSQRGKIRDIVRPTLEKWNSEMVSGLFEISKIMKESLEMTNLLVDSWLSKMTDNKIVCIENELPLQKIFWNIFFQKLDIRISNSSLDNLIKFIERYKTKKISIDVNAYINYEINKFCQLKLMKIADNKVLICINQKK